VLPRLVSFCGRLDSKFSFVQLIYIVIPSVVKVIPKTFHRCNALVEHLSQVILVKGLINLVVIRSELLDEYQTCPKPLCQSWSIRSLNLELDLFGLAHNLLN
jgi:hypothetical protein